MVRGWIVAIATLGLVAAPCGADSEEPGEMKPFVMPPLEAPGEWVDLRPIFDGPRGEDLPPIRTNDEGHFTAGGRRVRFWGVNLCFEACFPTHDVADRIARRLAAFGVNAVRFHHMDMRAFPRGIWKDDFSGFDPEALDRLDYLLAALKSRGLYADINLHVSRDFSRTGASASKDEVSSFGKLVCTFDPELIELQKRYARELLTHENRYTGLRYADDPVVGLVEISNENSAFLAMSRHYGKGVAPKYEAMLTEQWNAWLAERYESDEALRKAWAEGATPRGPELLRDGVLPAEAVGESWTIESHHGATMTTVREDEGLRLAIEKITDTAWHLMLKQVPLEVEKDRVYTARFRARAEKPRSIHLVVQRDGEPYENLGLSRSVRLGDAWERHDVTFTASADARDARFAFVLGGATADVWLADVSLTPGGRYGLRETESLEDGSVERLRSGDAATPARATDFMKFLAHVDRSFFEGMRDFLREELGVEAPITGTEGFALTSDWVQSHLDFVDSHAYWQHPHFPNRAWDPRDWTISNTPMVDEPAGSTLLGLTFQRVRRPDDEAPPRPFTCTEYQHPAPSDYQAEGIPMVASFAAAQDWDGVFLFAYSHSGNWDRAYPAGFFDMHSHPLKMVQMAAGALLFRRGDVPELPVAVATGLPPERMFRLAGRYGPWTDHIMNKPATEAPPAARFFGRYGIEPFAFKGAATRILQPTEKLQLPVESPEEGPWGWCSAGDVLQWSSRGKGTHTGVYTARGRRSAVLVGFAAGAERKVGPVHVTLERPEFAAVTLSALDGEPLEHSRRILLTACARLENTDQGWNKARTSVGDRWGEAPTLIEPVRARFRLDHASAPGARLVALDGRGRPLKELPVETREASLAWTLSGEPATLWYVLTVEPNEGGL